MGIPLMASRMKQRRNHASLRIDSGQVSAFVQIAINAGQGSIRKRYWHVREHAP